MYNFSNPIIPGFNPDPSICMVGDTFYLVTSSFEYFPGVPIYTSKNLVNWQCIGHCLTTSKQLDLNACYSSGGIYAPTIRYYDGTFFMVTTNTTHRGNFIVHATDPAGTWSDPVWVKQGGIDPSLLFDQGKVYFVSNGDCEGHSGIYLCEVNPFTGEMLTESVLISKGCGGRFPEAPHLYHIDDMYYLMLAEGGTEYGHMVTIARSKTIDGAYEPCPHNPILSHRDQEHVDILCTGHTDMVADQNGNWWMVALGIRTISTSNNGVMLHNLGRESFLVPVIWKNGWPIAGRNGVIDIEITADLPAAPISNYSYSMNSTSAKCLRLEEHFDKEQWNVQFSHIRNPQPGHYELIPSQKMLVLKGTDTTLSTACASPAFLGIHQTAFCQEIQATLSLPLNAALDSVPDVFPAAGLTVYYNNEHHYEILLTPYEGKYRILLRRQIYDLQAVTDIIETQYSCIQIKITADKEYYSFYYALPGEDYLFLGKGSTAAMCTEVTRKMSFTGTFFGMFAENITAGFQDFSRKVRELV